MDNGNLNKLRNLQELLANGQIIHFAELSEEEIIEMLDSRDSEEFEGEWLRVFHVLEDQADFSDSEIEKIREIAFKKTFEATNNSELAGYAADDFELIAKSLLIGYNDEWLNSLFLSYLQGVFPHSDLPLKKSGVELMLEMLLPEEQFA
jgi:hypothetical protein